MKQKPEKRSNTRAFIEANLETIVSALDQKLTHIESMLSALEKKKADQDRLDRFLKTVPTVKNHKASKQKVFVIHSKIEASQESGKLNRYSKKFK